MTTSQDERFMRLALSLGRRGWGNTWPNPAVGCVIVKAGRIVGRGWTQPGGRPHAEVVALRQAGEAARGADVYVTLEPCAHHGKTPPCSEALMAAQVGRVHVATTDPDPRTAGKGIAMLRDAGVEVRLGLCQAEADADHAGFFRRVVDGKPFVTLKLASSFDGRIATGTGESQWITGPEARLAVHAMRMAHDAVMVGGGTARADDPALTVRGLGAVRQPHRVIISRRLDVPLMGNLARTAGDVPVVLCHGSDADKSLVKTWQDLGAQLVPCRVKGGQLDAEDILQQLADLGLTRVFCEGGSALAASLIEAGLVSQIVGFTAGVTIGAEGLPNIGALGLGRLAEAQRYSLFDVRPVGGDLLHIWRPEN